MADEKAIKTKEKKLNKKSKFTIEKEGVCYNDALKVSDHIAKQSQTEDNHDIP